eukprot:COSAG02_NODE_2151_length_9656_cov_5.628754_5_plen_418_part_00
MIRLPQPAQQRPVRSPQLTSPAAAAVAAAATPRIRRQQHQQHETGEAGDALSPALAQFAQTSAAKILTGQSTGRVSALAAARQERLSSWGTQNTQAAALRGKQNLSPLELAVLPPESETEDVVPEQPDVPVLPEYMVAKIKEMGRSGGAAAESDHHQMYRKNSKHGLLRMRLSGQSIAQLFWFELRAPKLVWRTPPSDGQRYADGKLRGRMILPDLVEQVSHQRGSAEVIVHCGAQRMHLFAVSEEQASQWQKVLKRAAFAPPPLRRTGKQLWAFLRPRLQLVVALQEQWGNVHLLYGRASSLFEDTAMPPSVRDPDSSFSAVWDICQLFLLLYVSFTVPYRTCFDINVELWSFTFFFDMMVDIYCKSLSSHNCRRLMYLNADGVRAPSFIVRGTVLTDLILNFRTVSLHLFDGASV